MKQIIVKLRDGILSYFKFGWPLLFADVILSRWFGEPLSVWRWVLNDAAFAWVICAAIVPMLFLFNRARRERAMARICGLRDGDEREQSISGEASRFALLLSLAIEGILLFLTLITVSFSWNPGAPKGERGLLSVGMSFDTARHLNPLGVTGGAAHAKINWGGEILSPHAFLILALLILAQLSAFRIFASRRYTGNGE